MNTKKLVWIVTTALCAAAVSAIYLPAQDTASHKSQRYKLYLVPPSGGSDSTSVFGPTLRVLNNKGTLDSLGYTSMPDPYFGFVLHAVRTRKDVSTDLGALPPAITNISGVFSLSDNDAMVGVSENGQIDPLTGIPEFEAVSFTGGGVTDLGNFGGNGSLAYSVNNRGQVVGFALNTIPDAYASFLRGCTGINCFPLAQQVRAAIWDKGVLRDLGTLGGNDAMAININEAGQVAGASYTNTIPNPTTGIPSQDPFLWEGGKMVDVGNLGGTFAYPNYMNQSGQVVGLSTLAGDAVSRPFSWERGKLTDIGTFGGSYGEAFSVNNGGDVVGRTNLAGDQVHHAFLWRKSVLTDLGTLGANSTAYAINSSGQVVGASAVTPDTVHAFLWQKGSGMMDLNDLIPPGSGLYLESAYYLNDRGQISGDAILDSGHTRAYLLTPCDDDQHPGDCRSDTVISDTSAGAAPTGAVRAAPTGDEHISNFSDLLRQLEQRRQRLARPPAHSE